MNKAKPLSKAEKAWIRKVEKIFESCPERFGIWTTGMNSDLGVYDKDVAEEQGIEHDDLVMLNNAHLGHIYTGVVVDGLCG